MFCNAAKIGPKKVTKKDCTKNTYSFLEEKKVHLSLKLVTAVKMHV